MHGFTNDFEGQYFDKDIVPNISEIIFFDGGGYIGDTIPQIIKNYLDEIFYTTTNANIIKEYANNYKKLLEKIEKNKKSSLIINSNLELHKEQINE